MSEPLAVPFFSVIILTYDRPGPLRNCLQALTALDYPRNRFEVIVVDDGSPVSLEAVVELFETQIQLRLVTQANAGPAAARNTGAACAKGEFLAFTDDDCMPNPDWLKVLAQHFAKAPDVLVGGQTRNALPDNLYSTASQSLTSYIYGYYNADPEHARFFASNNLALAADRFAAVRGFDTVHTRTVSEDREFCDRWLYHHYRMNCVEAVVVYHAHVLTLRTFWRQHFNYGRGAARFQVRAQRGQWGFKVEPWSFYRDMLLHPWMQRQDWRAALLSLLLITSQVASAVGYFWERVGGTRQRLPS